MEIPQNKTEEVCNHTEYEASVFGDPKDNKEMRICKTCKKEGVFEVKKEIEICGKCNKPKKHESFKEQCHCGRPLEYSQEILDKAREYLKECEDEEVKVVKQSSEKYEMYDNKLKVKLPSKGGLAVYLGVRRDTLYDWATKYPEFSDIMEHLGAIQEDRLLNNGLSGDYNGTIAKVILTKHGYRDSVENLNTTIPVDEEAKKRGDKAVDDYLNEKKK